MKNKIILSIFALLIISLGIFFVFKPKPIIDKTRNQQITINDLNIIEENGSIMQSIIDDLNDDDKNKIIDILSQYNYRISCDRMSTYQITNGIEISLIIDSIPMHIVIGKTGFLYTDGQGMKYRIIHHKKLLDDINEIIS